jgi:ABC-type lipoprotein export system ATPase subunit
MELVCDNISFAYNREVSVFQGFSHVFRPGITVLKGYSGSGKTTLLKLLAGYLTVTAGRIITPTGLKVTSRRYHRRDVAYMFQGINLLPLTSVERNLHLAAEMAMLPRREWKPRCETLLHDLGLEKLRNRRADKLSGGQAQRAALARTLMKNAPTILLDEPTSGLDDGNTTIIKNLISKDAANRICIISTHDSRLLELADDLIDFDHSVPC